MFRNFLISYNMSQCSPLGTLWNRPCGNGLGGWLLGPWEETGADREGPSRRPQGEALTSDLGLLGSPAWRKSSRRLTGLWAPRTEQASLVPALSPLVKGHPGRSFPPVVLLRYFKILPPFYRGEK